MRILTALLTTLWLAGCVCLHVKKVEDPSTDPGVRFSLPKTLLAFTPKADGTVDFAVEHLPDASNTFAVSSTAVLAADTLDLTLEEGMLKQVTWHGDSTAVAAQLAATGGTLGKGVLDAQAAAAGAAAKAEAEGQKAASTLQEDLAAARATLAAFEEAGVTGVELAKAKAAVAALEARVEARAPGNAPGQTAFGPVLFEIKDDGTSVELVALAWQDGSKQQSFETTRPPKRGAYAKQLLPSGIVSADRPKAGELRRFTLRADGPLAGAEAAGLRRLKPEPVVPIADPGTVVELSVDGQKVNGLVLGGTPSGLYELQIRATRPDNTSFPHLVKFRVP